MQRQKHPDRTYLDWTADDPWPAGDDIFYECMACGCTVNSIANAQCGCGQLHVDADSGRAGCDDPTKVRIFKLMKG